RPTPRGGLPAGRTAALAGAGHGLVPGVAPGGALAATVDLPGPFAVGLTGVLYPEQRTAPPDDGFAFGLTYGELAGCWLPLAQLAPTVTRVRLELCAGAAAGGVDAGVFSGGATAPGGRWTFAAGAAAAGVLPIFPIVQAVWVGV